MFAFRASCSSALAASRRRPLLSATSSLFSQGAPMSSIASTSEKTIGDFLEPPLPVEPDADGPPAMTGRGYPRQRATKFAPIQGLLHEDLPSYRLHCRSSRNNTMVTFTDPDGKSLCWYSGGKLKFKKANRATYEAGYQCAVNTFKVIEELARVKAFKLDLFLTGFGQGRDAMKTALLSVEGDAVRPLIKQIQDRTPIKIGGTRSKKARRL